jgi:hypothetical protein
MADTLVAGTPRPVLVDGRNPFADETVTAGLELVIAAPDANGAVFVSVADGVADASTDTITVQPGSEDTNRTAGTDDITISVPVATSTPLVVTLG